jgi:ubiquinone/menaquinone biosynthesis C-methylase UbiE
MSMRGDTRRQATLRDRLIQEGKGMHIQPYVTKILSKLKPGSKLCDIGCGTAHVLGALAEHRDNADLIGVDVSRAMLRIAAERCARFRNIHLVLGDGLQLPFREETLGILTVRLSEYSPQEAYRVLRSGGHLFEYGLGPDANKEVMEYFPERIEEESFFVPHDPAEWKKEVCEEILEAGFSVNSVEDYRETELYQSTTELKDLIEMVPLVQDFDRKRDAARLDDLKRRHGAKNGIPITWHYYIMEAKRP